MSEHVSHNLILSPNLKPITFGKFKRMMAKLKVPDDAVLKFAGEKWRKVTCVSFCKTEKEISLWS